MTISNHWIRRGFWFSVMMPLVGLLILLLHGTVNISVPISDAQRRIDDRLPMIIERLLVRYTVTEFNLEFRSDGRIGFNGRFSAAAPIGQATGQIAGSGVLMYEDGSFYIRNVAMEKLTLANDHEGSHINRLPELVRNKLISDGPLILERAVALYLDRYPVYVLRETDVRHSLAKLALKSVDVKTNELVVTLDPATFLLRLLAYLAIGFIALAVAIAIMVSTANGTAGLGWLLLISGS